MSTTQVSLSVGLLLGIVLTFGGFGPFVVVLVFGAVGLVVGRILDGKLDPQALLGRGADHVRLGRGSDRR